MRIGDLTSLLKPRSEERFRNLSAGSKNPGTGSGLLGSARHLRTVCHRRSLCRHGKREAALAYRRSLFQEPGYRPRVVAESLRFLSAVRISASFLWTFKGLDRARTLYEKVGFTLCLEHTVRQWGKDITEQRYELALSVTGQTVTPR